jgi:tetratricopeptide (TPR) repeat protein
LLAAQRTDPGHESPAGETAFIVGAALQALSREAEAEASLREALRTNPAHRLAGIALAHLQRNQGRYRAAAATVEALVAAVPGDRNFALHAIGFLRDTPSPVEAERLWQSTRQDANSDPEASYVGGEIASMAVDFTAARTRFDHCLTLDPINPGALHARAVAGPLTRADAFAAHLERLTHDRQRLPLDSRIMLDFVLGKLAMDCGGTGQHLQQVHALHRPMHQIRSESTRTAAMTSCSSSVCRDPAKPSSPLGWDNTPTSPSAANRRGLACAKSRDRFFQVRQASAPGRRPEVTLPRQEPIEFLPSGSRRT